MLTIGVDVIRGFLLVTALRLRKITVHLRKSSNKLSMVLIAYMTLCTAQLLYQLQHFLFCYFVVDLLDLLHFMLIYIEHYTICSLTVIS